MNLRDMEYVVTVADLKNFSQAAELCHVSQPTLSNQIKKMEEFLGVQLFERSNRRVMLTEIGEQIVQHARRVLREVENIHEIAEHAHDPLSGTFRLGAFPTLSTYLFPTIAPGVKETLPKLKLVLVEDKTAQLIELLLRGQLDAALLALPVYDDQLVSQKLFDDPFYLAAPKGHPLAKQKKITQAALNGEKLLLLDEGHCLRDQALDVCQAIGLGEDQDFRATGLETLRQMVKAGMGITLMPGIARRQDDEGIAYIPFATPAPSRTIGLVWRKTSARMKVMEKLIGMMKHP
ncbi:LysR family transcriptional regulator [bacterium]|nr:LysR family transcriptional regulator [bacterium]